MQQMTFLQRVDGIVNYTAISPERYLPRMRHASTMPFEKMEEGYTKLVLTGDGTQVHRD